uniref:Leucine-rich repeat-containing N-terminal plant-type domain-containing protein n=1 Tax=Fagus sylvatica TaxID=28930 RepID=A0A2N9FNL4_FAGSY
MRISLFSWLFFIPICSILLNFGIFVVSGQCIDDQRNLLIELKEQPQIQHDGGHVIGLNLNNESISGGLNNSSSLFRLQYLQNLSLAYNNFNSSRIPLEFGNLTNLIYLNLSTAGFAEQIPIEISTPSQGALPDSIGNLKMLSKIDLSICNFSGSIPSSMENLTQLVYLDLSSNNFNGSVPPFSMAKNLTQINLSRNSLTGQITSTHWKDLPNLVNLDLRSNSLEGSIPVSLFSLPSLQKLQLSNNQFSGRLNHSSVSSYSLDTLDLSSNNLEGSIPTSVFELRVTSKGLDIELVKILTIFTSIDVSCNNLEGQIPEKLGELKSLYGLNLSHNAITGQIPPALGNLTMLESLDLSSNKLTGEIPMHLVDLIFLGSSRPFVQSIAKCQSDEALPPQLHHLFSNTKNKRHSSSSTTLIGFDWQFILTGLGFGVGAAVVVAPLMFWEKGRKWHDDSIDKVLLVILPMIGLSYTGCNNFKVEAEEDIEDENTDDCEDDDDDDEMEDEEFRGRCRFYRIITPERGDENRT